MIMIINVGNFLGKKKVEFLFEFLGDFYVIVNLLKYPNEEKILLKIN